MSDPIAAALRSIIEELAPWAEVRDVRWLHVDPPNVLTVNILKRDGDGRFVLTDDRTDVETETIVHGVDW